MIAATSCHIASDIQHSVIKVVHDLFLQNDAIKSQMINGGIIELLCHLLVSTFEHKQALYAKGLTSEVNHVQGAGLTFIQVMTWIPTGRLKSTCSDY